MAANARRSRIRINNVTLGRDDFGVIYERRNVLAEKESDRGNAGSFSGLVFMPDENARMRGEEMLHALLLSSDVIKLR